MSDRYEQPERGSYTDRWDIVLNRNFAEIGDDVDQLFEEKDENARFPRDAAEIKSAIESAPDGTRIILPSDQDQYTIDNPINVTTSITIIGPGKDSATGTLTKQNNEDLFYASGCSPTFQGVVAMGGDQGGYGIHTAGGTDRVGRITIRDTAMNDMTGGYYLNSANVSYIANSQAKNTETVPSLEIGGENANAATIINFDARPGTDGEGVVVDGAYGTNIIGGYVDGSTGDGWYINSDQVTVIGAGGEGNANNTIHIGSSADYGMIIPGYCHEGIVNNGGEGIQVINGNSVDLSFESGEINVPTMTVGDGGDISGNWAFSQDQDDRALNAELRGTGASNVNFKLVGGSGGGNDFENPEAGQGYVVTTPDGSAQYRIRVDNSGDLVTEQL